MSPLITLSVFNRDPSYFSLSASLTDSDGYSCGFSMAISEERSSSTIKLSLSLVTAELSTKNTHMLKGHEGAVLAAMFNGDGNYALTYGKDRAIYIWNPHRGILIKTYKSHGREVRDIHVTSDNAKFCSCGGDRQVYYWDVSTGRVIRNSVVMMKR